MRCPKCGGEQYYNCGDPNCSCAGHPPGTHQIDLGGELLGCPYTECGLAMSIDEWEIEAMRQVVES